MPSTDLLSCALIGYGHWGQIVERYITGSGLFSLQYIVKSSRSGPEQLGQVLADPDLAAVFICTPVSTHYDLAKAALLCGKHVFCEKPLARAPREARQLAELAAERGLCLYTDYIYALSPSLNYLKENIERLGSLSYIRGELLQFGRFYAGDHVQEVLGVHLLSAILHLFGTREIPEVLDHHPIHTSGQRVDAAEAVLRLPNIPRISLECSLVSPVRRRRLIVQGQKGVLTFDPLCERTAAITLYESREIGYSVAEESGVCCDEKNNLRTAVAVFYKNIQSNAPGNTALSLAVTEALDRLREFTLRKNEPFSSRVNDSIKKGNAT